VPSLNGGGGGRRQSNLKGLFTTECEFLSLLHETDPADRSEEFDV